jgi:hypothetical protein
MRAEEDDSLPSMVLTFVGMRTVFPDIAVRFQVDAPNQSSLSRTTTSPELQIDHGPNLRHHDGLDDNRLAVEHLVADQERATKPERLPVVLSRQEIAKVLPEFQGLRQLMFLVIRRTSSRGRWIGWES